jgi:DeoR family transcriptional regulator, suf operon transcriptional repressor
MESLAELLAERRIPVSVENSPQGAVLTQHACPYPKLAEQDQGICNMEQMMFSELLGQDVELTHCRLEGGGDCRFQAT